MKSGKAFITGQPKQVETSNNNDDDDDDELRCPVTAMQTLRRRRDITCTDS
jgi:hypothetical protein